MGTITCLVADGEEFGVFFFCLFGAGGFEIDLGEKISTVCLIEFVSAPFADS